jgi:hypothetical protein
MYDDIVSAFARFAKEKSEASMPPKEDSAWKERMQLWKDACKVAKKEATRAKKAAKKATTRLRTFKKSLSKQEENEREVSDRLARETGGAREVQTLSGRIDVLTATEVIEVKRIDDWKHSIGQVVAYGTHFPSHKKRIHLFGRQDLMESYTLLKKQIDTLCNSLDIDVTYEISIAVM